MFKNWFGKSSAKDSPPRTDPVDATAVARLEELTHRAIYQAQITAQRNYMVYREIALAIRRRRWHHSFVEGSASWFKGVERPNDHAPTRGSVASAQTT